MSYCCSLVTLVADAATFRKSPGVISTTSEVARRGRCNRREANGRRALTDGPRPAQAFRLAANKRGALSIGAPISEAG
jgi:hypothetical protein